MADGEITLKLDPDVADRLRAAAAAEGKSVETYASERLTDLLGVDLNWTEDFARAEEFDRTGESYSPEEFADLLRKAVAAKRRA